MIQIEYRVKNLSGPVLPLRPQPHQFVLPCCCIFVSLFNNCNEHVSHQTKLLSFNAGLSIRSDKKLSVRRLTCRKMDELLNNKLYTERKIFTMKQNFEWKNKLSTHNRPFNHKLLCLARFRKGPTDNTHSHSYYNSHKFFIARKTKQINARIEVCRTNCYHNWFVHSGHNNIGP